LRFLLRAEADDLLLRTPAVGTDVEPVAPRPTLGSRLAKTPLRRPAATSSLMNPWTRTRFERFPRPRQRIKIAAELDFLWSRVWESNPRPHDYKAHSERPSGVVSCRLIASELVQRDLPCHAVSPRVGVFQTVRGHSVDTKSAKDRRFMYPIAPAGPTERSYFSRRSLSKADEQRFVRRRNTLNRRLSGGHRLKNDEQPIERLRVGHYVPIVLNRNPAIPKLLGNRPIHGPTLHPDHSLLRPEPVHRGSPHGAADPGVCRWSRGTALLLLLPTIPLFANTGNRASFVNTHAVGWRSP